VKAHTDPNALTWREIAVIIAALVFSSAFGAVIGWVA